MDGLNQSLEATHIDENMATSSQGAQGAIDVEQDYYMPVVRGKSDESYDSESDDEVEVSEETSDKMKKAAREQKLGRKAYNKKDYEKAANHFHKAINLNKKEITCHYRLAEVKFEQGKYEECIEICGRAIKVGKENKGSVKKVANSMLLRGKAWKEQGNVDKERTDIERANKFLTSIAVVKMEKGKYYEALDFVTESFQNYYRFEWKGEDSMTMFDLHWKVTACYLVGVFESIISTSLDESKIRRARFYIEQKQLADDAFKKNDHSLASDKYFWLIVKSPKPATQFLMSLAKAAEGDKKWRLCRDLCVHLNWIEPAFRPDGSIDQEMKEIFTEAGVLKSKAIRRVNNLGEDFDKMFSEKLAARKVKDQCIMTYKRFAKLRPGITKERFNYFQNMADFSGCGKVTVKEFNLFRECAYKYWGEHGGLN